MFTGFQSTSPRTNLLQICCDNSKKRNSFSQNEMGKHREKGRPQRLGVTIKEVYRGAA